MYRTTLILAFLFLTSLTFAGDTSDYSFSKTVDMSYEDALVKVTEELKTAGFGIISETDVKATMKNKLDVDMKPYKILGACNPKLAHDAIQAEQQIGLFLPCNVIVYVNDEDKTVISAVDPVKMMMAVENPQLEKTAMQVRDKLKAVIDNL